MKTVYKILIGIVIAAVVCAAAVFGYKMYIGNSITMSMDMETLPLEYGVPFVFGDYVDADGVEVISHTNIDTSHTGPGRMEVTIRKKGFLGLGSEKKFDVPYNVSDSLPPEITVLNETVQYDEGELFDYKENIANVADRVDGRLEYSDNLKPGTYTVSDNRDTDEAGEFTVTVTAMDKNSLQSEKQFTVRINPKQPETQYEYLLAVNRINNFVTVYTADEEGEFTIPYKCFICSTGEDSSTPIGTYTTEENYRWRLLFGPCYGQYATRIVDHILFHSVPYEEEDPSTLEYEEYNELGNSVSAGCIRLCVRDAKWIYDNCPTGTTVIIYDDESETAPVEPDAIYKIDPASDNRGWDPTDPDHRNPWNNAVTD